MITGTVLQPTKLFFSRAGTATGRYLQIGDELIADIKDAQWLHLTGINGAVSGDLWTSAGANGQYILVTITNDAPPPVPPPVPVQEYIIHHKDGQADRKFIPE